MDTIIAGRSGIQDAPPKKNTVNGIGLMFVTPGLVPRNQVLAAGERFPARSNHCRFSDSFVVPRRAKTRSLIMRVWDLIPRGFSTATSSRF
jgi:hypothetical protein